jgi:hypothetical protein
LIVLSNWVISSFQEASTILQGGQFEGERRDIPVLLGVPNRDQGSEATPLKCSLLG